MADPLISHGEAEIFKAGCHLGLFGLAVMVLGYNGMMWSHCRQRHHAINVVVYAALVWFEGRQIHRHLQ